MKQMSEGELLAQLRQHTTGNRAEIEASKYAECVSCLESYQARQVQSWMDEWTSPEKQNRVKRWSAECPRCGKATVIGDASGLLSQHYTVVVHDILSNQKSKGRQVRFPPIAAVSSPAVSVSMRRDKNRETGQWQISGRRADTLVDDLAIFLQEIAASGGLIAGIDDVLPADGHLVAGGLAEAVLRAEGFPYPSDEYTLRPRLVRLFTERYGSTVSASDYRV